MNIMKGLIQTPSLTKEDLLCLDIGIDVPMLNKQLLGENKLKDEVGKRKKRSLERIGIE